MKKDPEGYQVGGLGNLRVSKKILDAKYDANYKKVGDWEYKAGSTVIGKIVKELLTGKDSGKNPYYAEQRDLRARRDALEKKIRDMKDGMNK